jgi:hypothetical protein
MHPSVDPSLLTLRAARDLLGRRRKELARHGVRVFKTRFMLRRGNRLSRVPNPVDCMKVE